MADKIIFKEISFGDALSDHSGKRIEIYKTISWFLIIVWRMDKKEYFNLITNRNKLMVNYNAKENALFLSTSSKSAIDSGIEKWTDTINLGR